MSQNPPACRTPVYFKPLVQKTDYKDLSCPSLCECQIRLQKRLFPPPPIACPCGMSKKGKEKNNRSVLLTRVHLYESRSSECISDPVSSSFEVPLRRLALCSSLRTLGARGPQSGISFIPTLHYVPEEFCSYCSSLSLFPIWVHSNRPCRKLRCSRPLRVPVVCSLTRSQQSG